MPELSTNPEPMAYQLRVILRGVSPLIWRRLLVCSDSTIADAHRMLQVAFGWSDEHLHRFVIHGRRYGEDELVDPRRVRLADLGLRLRERFLYEYDFTDGWQHEVRLEQVLPIDSRRRYPVCIGGRRAAPPEDCGGPWAFLELRHHYSVVTIADRMLALLSPLIADRRNAGDNPVADRDDVQGVQSEDGDDHAEEFATLLHWLRIDRFDRRATNCRLAQIEVAPARAAA